LAGAGCSRLLADFGAAVVMVEPPSGSPLRRLEPFAVDPSTGERISVAAAYVLANKRSLELDSTSVDGKRLRERLVARADVVITSDPTMDELLAEQASRDPRLI